jgi:NAD(P)-dependent dehydrogenase (short-subunit alcohol dehydrogenase family)
MFRLDHKVVLVTGAGSGIGLEISKACAAQGARVVAADLRLDAAQQAVKQISAAGGQAQARQVDVANAASVQALFADPGDWGAPAILVNNAGIAHVGSLATTEPEDFDKIMAVNLRGQYLVSRAALPAMLKNKYGVIVNLCSIAALTGLVDRFAYSVSKGGILAMTRSIAADYMKDGIRCNCICPARVHTPFVDGFISKNYPGKEKEKFEELSAYQPIGRMGRPEEVAAMAVYLCSDESAFVTGHAFPLDGGVLST